MNLRELLRQYAQETSTNRQRKIKKCSSQTFVTETGESVRYDRNSERCEQIKVKTEKRRK